ncbi:MAG: hypothetical protein ACT4NU_00525 [Chromatiales bacterium]
MSKKILISVVVIFVVALGLGYLVHGVLVHQDYAKLAGLFRTEQDAANYFPYMLLAHALFAFGSISGAGKKSRF